MRADRAAPTPPQPQPQPPPTATTVSGDPGSEPAGDAGSGPAGDPATAPRAAGAPRPASTGLTLAAVVTVVGAWLLVLVLITRVEVGSGVRDLARFGHLAALAVGFGAALTVEWCGLLWLLRRRSLRLVTQVAQATHLPIWLGLAGLAVTGVMLGQQLGTSTLVKLAAVLMVALNGVYAARLQRHLTAAGEHAQRGLLRRAALSATVSQLGWWGAVVIGFVNAHS